MNNNIAYEISDGIVVNAIVYDINQPLPENYVIRDYPLVTGFIESFGDFYPPNTTQDEIDLRLSIQTTSVENNILDYNARLEDLISNYPEVNGEGEELEIPPEILEEKEKIKK